MHWIQYHILLELVRHSHRRHSQLRPEGVEGNLFQYYLTRLLKEGMVEKNDNQYQLTVKGRQFAGTLSLQSGRPRLQPKILTAVICRNEKDEFLMTRWRREPNSGLVSFPHGMMHYGHTIAQMAEVEFAEKAGMSGTFTYRGEVAVRGYLKGVVDRHMIVHLMEALNFQADQQDRIRQELGEPFWSSVDAIPRAEWLPGFYEIAQLAVAEKKIVFAEIDVQVDIDSQ